MLQHAHTIPASTRPGAPLRPAPLLVLCALAALLFSGCAGRVSSSEIRSSIANGSVASLETELGDTHSSHGEMVTALNLARIRQMNGQWRKSIEAYEEASTLLGEYENRAIINVRGLLASAGAATLSRGADSYFGTGYERSLLHTFNALNYVMLGDYAGAAVEMRRMDQRQELWLEESQARIEKALQSGSGYSSPDDLPVGYSMRDMLRDEAVRNLLNNYQDPFSYALGAVLYRINGDYQAADVSMRRAMALDRNAEQLFARAWPAGNSGKNKKEQHEGGTAKVPPLPLSPPRGEQALDRPATDVPETQEVTILAFTGLAPSLGVENVRLWFPAVGYVLIDLPAYTRPVRGDAPDARVPDGSRPDEPGPGESGPDGPGSGKSGPGRPDPDAPPRTLAGFIFYPLLRTDLLAYRTLRDELGAEMALAASRAVVRAGIAGGAYAAAASHKDTRHIAPLVGALTTVILDVFSTSMSGSVRNWETLPNTGYIAMETVPRGSAVTIGRGSAKRLIPLPREARGVIILVTELSRHHVKVSHAIY